jgi:thymidylate synthase ThyX
MSNIFCLTDEQGSLLPPAVQATVLAKYSRSPQSARELVKSLTEEEANKFQDKWVVQYGHSSVAELATIPICFEGVSIIASKAIESFQRAGYSEKSTRYQEFSADSFVLPDGAPSAMRHAVSNLYSTYQDLLDPMFRICARAMNKDPDDPATKSDRTVKARAFDNVRYLLPAGTGTNLAAVMNMLDIRKLITTMRGSPNYEFQHIGNMVYRAVMEIAPTLVKHTDPDTFTLRPKSLGPIPDTFSGDRKPYVSLMSPKTFSSEPDHRLDLMIVSQFQARVADLYEMGWTAFCKYMDERPAHSEVPQVFRGIDLVFDVMMDYGAYRDLQRHRRCEQFSEPLGLSHGYVVPDDIKGTNLEQKYHDAMMMANCNVIDPLWTQYVTPLGYLHRTQFKMDLAEAYYIIELRTKPQGHISYRKIAYEMYEILNSRWPELMKWCRAIRPDSIGAHT